MKRLREVGVTSFTIHGRYAWQKGDKRGVADWAAIKRIKEELGKDIVVIGNGNIGEHEDFEQMIKETGVDGGMAGYIY
jgi:tRNA-dihydrouridine synthase 1